VEEVFAEIKHWIQSYNSVFQATQDPRVLIAVANSTVSKDNCLSYIKDSGYL